MTTVKLASAGTSRVCSTKRKQSAWRHRSGERKESAGLRRLYVREHWRRAHEIVLIWSASRRMASAPGALSSLSALPSESVVMSMAVLGLGAKAKAQSDRARSDIGREQRCTQKFVAQRPEQPPTPEPIQLPLSSSSASKQSSERKEASSVIGAQEFPCCSVVSKRYSVTRSNLPRMNHGRSPYSLNAFSLSTIRASWRARSRVISRSFSIPVSASASASRPVLALE